MPIPIVLAATLSITQPSPLPFSAAVSDAELAYVTPGAVTRTPTEQVYGHFPARLTTGEEIDCWWAYDGAAMIAEAVHPTQTFPTGFNASSLQQYLSTGRLEVGVSTSTS